MIRGFVLSGLLVAGSAEAGEIRSFTLTDGRSFVAEILLTESDGIRVRTPQGDMSVPFSLLEDMSAVDPSSWGSQPPWRVVLGPGPAQSELARALSDMPGISVITLAASDLGACAPSDARCLGTTVFGAWAWVVAHAEDGAGWRLESALSSGRSGHVARASTVDDLAAALHPLLELSPPPPPLVVEAPEAPAPPPAAEPPPLPEVGWDAERVARVSWAPVPGLPSLRQGDGARAAAAWATVVPATALWVTAAGAVAQSAPEHVLLAAGGFYAVTVAANQAFGTMSLGRTSTWWAPVDGGAVVGVRTELPRAASRR